MALSRRSLLIGSGILAAGGATVGAAFMHAMDEDRLGAEGFTAKSVPVGSSPLLLFDFNNVSDRSIVASVGRVMMDADQFRALPPTFDKIFHPSSTSPFSAETVGKVVVFGSSRPDKSGAVVWAEWTEEDLIGLLDTTESAITTESYLDRTLYTSGATSVAAVADTAFVVGSESAVRDTIESWHGDKEPVGGRTLDTFERTPLEAQVRFSFDRLSLNCESVPSPAGGYSSLGQIYGWVSSESEHLRVKLQTREDADIDAITAALRDDLGIVDYDDQAALPPDAVSAVTVTHENDAVVIEYDPSNGTTPFGDVLLAIICIA